MIERKWNTELKKEKESLLTKTIYHTLLNLGLPSRKIRDALKLLPRSKIIKIFYDDKHQVKGYLIKVPSRSRKNYYHYVTVSYYEIKCDCEDAYYRRDICAHLIVGIIFLLQFLNVTEAQVRELIEQFKRGLAYGRGRSYDNLSSRIGRVSNTNPYNK